MSDSRFFDDRLTYLSFVTTSNEKNVVANEISSVIKSISKEKAALRIFDAGIGDGSLLMNVIKNCHKEFPYIPFFIMAKEISIEDVRLALEKLSDRFIEHPNMVFTITNLYFSEAATLKSNNSKKQKNMKWNTLALEGNSSFEFNQQLTNIDNLLQDSWTIDEDPDTNRASYRNPSVLTIYRKDHENLIDRYIPTKDDDKKVFDLVLASQPYRSRTSEKKKVDFVIKPMIDILNKNGKLVVVHSCGGDSVSKVVKELWPNDVPFPTPAKSIIEYLKKSLTNKKLDDLVFHKPVNFEYSLKSIPDDNNSIATSLFSAAWNNIVYVGQMTEDQINSAQKDGKHIEVIEKMLDDNNNIVKFKNEMFVIEKNRIFKP
jgi:hypothetical protein